MGYFDSIAGVEDLIRAIVNVENEAECRAFLEDLCTIKELSDMSQRLDVAILLSQGMSYQRIMEQVDISTATIGRVSRCLNHGAGGYQTAIEKLKED
jgi:TrpR-related protein YerC/YecD